MKTFSRLAVLPGPVGANGPFTTMLKIAPLRGNVGVEIVHARSVGRIDQARR